MREPETHPLFNPDITWHSIQELENNRRIAIEKQQAQREEGYRRKAKEKPSHLLKKEGQ